MKFDLGGDSSFSFGDFKMNGPWWLMLPVFILFLWSVFWIMRDAEQRGKSGCLALLFLVVASWPVSILWWLWLRPPSDQTPKPSLPPPLPEP